tara:strand:+ start:56 stop:250 length:195 start_codon:yes stop_codon:yes gene_type:complete
MKIELDREDIIKEIDEHYRNDADFLYEIIDNSTTNWDVIREVTSKLLDALKNNDELNDIKNYLD